MRTIFAFENTGNIDSDKLILKNWQDGELAEKVVDNVKINGEFYTLYAYTYPNELVAGETTEPSLFQVAMAAEADNEVVKAIREGDAAIFVGQSDGSVTEDLSALVSTGRMIG